MVTYTVNNVPGYCMGDPDALLSFQLKPLEKGLGFQVTSQSPLITNFLKKNNFQASTGLTVAIDKYPEYRESELTIYLRGDDWSKNLKTDVTAFARNKVRDDRQVRIEKTLRELVSYVKKVSQPVWSFARPTNTVWNCNPVFVY